MKKLTSTLFLIIGSLASLISFALYFMGLGKKQAINEQEKAFREKKEGNTKKGERIEKEHQDLNTSDVASRLNKLSNNKSTS